MVTHGLLFSNRILLVTIIDGLILLHNNRSLSFIVTKIIDYTDLLPIIYIWKFVRLSLIVSISQFLFISIFFMVLELRFLSTFA